MSAQPSNAVRQARQYLESLRQAGVEWLPVATAADQAQPLFAVEELTLSAPATDELAPPDRRVALQMLAEQVAGCTRCPELLSSRTQTVFADGPLGAELCFIGEAPGADEDAQGKPFVGAAGQLLNKIIAACGLKREEVYICNILKCRPPGNRTPKVEEALHCREYLTPARIGAAQVHLRAGELRGPAPLGNHAIVGPAPGPFPRLPRHPGAGDLSPGLLAAPPQPGKKTRGVARHAAADGLWAGRFRRQKSERINYSLSTTASSSVSSCCNCLSVTGRTILQQCSRDWTWSTQSPLAFRQYQNARTSNDSGAWPPPSLCQR